MSLIYGRLTMPLCIIQQPVSVYDSPFYHIALWSGGWGISPMPATAPRISNYLLEKCRIVHQQPEDCWIWWPTSQILGMGLALHFWCYPVQLPGDVLGLQRLYDYRILYDYRLYVICRSIMYPTNSNFEHGRCRVPQERNYHIFYQLCTAFSKAPGRHTARWIHMVKSMW